MNNPFEVIEAKLSHLESLILAINTQPREAGKETDKLLSVQEAAQFLKLTVPTIYSKVSRGELPVMKRSKRLYFSQIELTEYLKQGRKKSFSDIDNDADTYLSKTK